MKRYIEWFVNIAIFVVCVLTVLTFLETHRRTPNHAALAKVGDKVKLEGVNWSDNKRTLLLLMNKGCRFCEMSVPFYQKLLQKAKQEHRIRILAALPQEAKVTREYLKSMGLQLDDVLKADFRVLGIVSTPCILLVDGNGVIKRQWLGYLKADAENEVMMALAI
jgi:hypothetical protein